MNQTLKRRLTILLCAVMLLSLLPIGATAAITLETNVQKILNDAYALEDGASLAYEATLTGKITSIKDIYSPTFDNISVWMEMPGYADQPILAYRVKGEGAKDLQVGSTITVTGTITNYKGTIEFKQGCTLDKVVSCGGTAPVAPSDPKQIVAEAYALAEGKSLPYQATLTGEIYNIGKYNETYGDLTLNILVEGKEFECYALKGENLQDLVIGDVITVTGTIKNYFGKIEFDKPTLDNVVKNEGGEGSSDESTVPTTPKEIMDAAYALEPGETLEGTYTLVGAISTIDTPWSDPYGNITVSITVEGKALKCFRLAGEGAKELAIGDIITVTGSITNYNGKVQFAQGCTLDNVVKSGNLTPTVPADPKEIVDEAYALKGGAVLPYEATLTGKLTEIVTGYNSTYKNITVKLVIESRENKPILCYRMKGDGCETLKVGDTITVTGNIKNYVKTDSDTGETTSTIEFTPCTLVAVDGGNTGSSGTGIEGLNSLAIVGSGIPGVPEWSPSAEEGNMTEVSLGIFEKTLTCTAGTTMKLKIVGNDAWVDSWNFGSADIVLGRVAELENGGGSWDMPLTLEKDCTIRITVNLNPLAYGGAATILVEDVSVKKVTMSVKVPASWSEVYVFSWDSNGNFVLGDWPGAMILKNGQWYQGVIPDNVTNLVINNGFLQSEDLYIEAGKDVWIVVSENTDGNGKHLAVATYTAPPSVTCAQGDLNGDGKLNIADVSKLYAHIRGSKVITDLDVLARADVSGEGKLNIADVSKLYAYVRGVSPEAIVDEAYRLPENAQMAKPVTLTGTVTEILEPYNSKYKAVTLVMQIDGRADKPIICSRLRGEDAAYVMAGDTVTVTGILQNYYGSVEFAEGCSLDKWVDVPSLEEQQWAAVDAAYQLPENSSMDRKETLTGKVISIDQAYTSNLPYINITIAVPGREDKPIGCYRLVGADIALVKIGDTVTVAGTLRNYYGTVEFAANCSLVDNTPDGTTVETDPLRIVDAAYSLAKDTQMAYDVTLTGRVSAVKTAYDVSFGNITVEILVTGRESKPILCYRLKGDGCDKIAVNDTIQVVGRIKNYNGTIEFDAGCTLLSRTSGGGALVVVETDPAKIMAAAGKLAENAELPYEVTLSGKVTSVDDAYDSEYQNVTVTIAVSGANNQPLKLYRLKGEGVDKLAAGDTITVEGTIKNYNGELEMVNGTMTARTSGGGKPPVAQTDYKKIVDEAYALQNGASLAYTATLQGRITELQSPYDAAYGNMTVAIVVVGREDKPILCYRMKGDTIGNHLCVGDTITVEGKIRKYNGTIEFDSGCQMTERKAGSISKPSDPKKIVDAAFALAENTSLPYFSTLTGVVKSIDEPYTDQYKNVTLTMTVQGSNGAKDIKVYRMKGNDAANVAVGNTITVTGAIKNYVGTDKETGEKKPPVIEFDAGCILETLRR